jgi:D-lactate dehydrogenase
MIKKSSLSQMKDNIMLINTSRGALINTSDIIEALKCQSWLLGLMYTGRKLFFKDLSRDIIQ